VQNWPEDGKEIILEDNIKTDLKGMGVDNLDLMIHASYDRIRKGILVNTVLNLQIA